MKTTHSAFLSGDGNLGRSNPRHRPSQKQRSRQDVRWRSVASGYLETKLKQNGYRVYPSCTTMFGLPAPLSRVIENDHKTSALPVKPGRDFGNICLCCAFRHGARWLSKQVVEAERSAARDFGATAIFTDL